MKSKPRVTVWNEYRHELSDEKVRKVYSDGIHNAIAGFLTEAGFPTKTATLDEPEHGLTAERLEQTEVLVWWGHMAHDEVSRCNHRPGAGTHPRWHGPDRTAFSPLL